MGTLGVRVEIEELMFCKFRLQLWKNGGKSRQSTIAGSISQDEVEDRARAILSAQVRASPCGQ